MTTETAHTMDNTGSRFGMWVFLFTEIMLFGGLFVLFAAYFNEYQTEFISGGKELDVIFGAANTLILLTSSFTVAASITAIRKNEVKHALALLWATIGLGALFLVNKYFEWGHKFEHGIYPNSDKLNSGPVGENIFFGLYYIITGLHGLHIVIGLGALITAVILMKREKVTAEHYVFLENSGLYWHLVDLIWIFLFPLFYLVL